MEGGEGGKEDVQLAATREVRDRAGHVTVRKGEVRSVDEESVERSAAGRHRSRQRALPVRWKGLSVQRAEQIPIHRLGTQLHVVHRQHGTARLERDRAAETRPRRPHIQLAQRVVEVAKVALVPDVQNHPAAARRGQRRIHPRHILQRYRITLDAHRVSHREVAPPGHLAFGATGGAGQVPMGRLDPCRVAQQPYHASHVAPPERRHRFIGMHGVDHEQPAGTVRVGDPCMRDCRVGIRPSVALGVPLARPADLVILSREIDAQGAVTPCTPQGIVRVPGNRDAKLGMAHVRRVDDDEVAESAARHPSRRWLARREHPFEVPAPILVLPQHDDRSLDVEPAEVQTSIDDVSDIVFELDAARRDEQRILVVAQLQRVDRHAGEEVSAHRPDVQRSLHVRGNLLLDAAPQPRLPGVGVQEKRTDADPDHPEHDERAQGDDDDEAAAGGASHVRGGARSRDRSRR